MKFLIVVLAVVAACAAQSDEDWQRYQQAYGKAYRSADEAVNRRAVWENNWRKIKSHNEKYAKGETTYTLGENQFADMTFEEFSEQYLGFNTKMVNKNTEEHKMSGRAVSKQKDLRNNGWVTSVKNQGQCGGCWSFATIGAVEVLYARTQSVSDLDLSEQYLIDCSKGKTTLFGILTTETNKGCNGGQLISTYGDMAKQGNMLETKYPYRANNITCNLPSPNTYKISGSVSCTTEDAIIDAVDTGNAVSVAIAVSNNFQLYKGGVYVGTAEENKAGLNHAVLAVGYDISGQGVAHYIIKNSWGATWGESGFFRLAHGASHLGIKNTMNAYPKP